MKELSLLSSMPNISTPAYDSNALNKLKYQVGQNADQQGLRQVAQQLEGVFVQMMLKSMREAIPQESMFNSESTKMYTSLYDQQIAQDLSKKGLGFADMIEKQLSAKVTMEPSELAGKTPMPLDSSDIFQSMPTQALGQLYRAMQPLQNAVESTVDKLKGLSESSASFAAKLLGPAKQATQGTGIHHLLVVAQAALESGWGKREILTGDGKPSYNLFGIKAGRYWKGPVTNIMTTEVIDGKSIKMRDNFRVYGSYVEAIQDYLRLLTESPRYAKVPQAKTPEQAAYHIQEAGYATDPGYAKKLVSIIGQLKGQGEQVAKTYTHDLSELF
ncbi:TPA: flagellar assembly peptidoglycan hydrolase FlgJ [Proteus mirabilis]|nr:flagellar assembly peptidoglycan hydrolase FlgJ [Proteus mirabilis]